MNNEQDSPEQPVKMAEDQPVARAPKLEYWQILLGLTLSVGSIVLAFQGVNFSQVISTIPEAVPGYIALALVASVATLVAKAIRWRYLFHQKAPSFHSSFAIQNIGTFINSIVPARIGDLLRAYLMGEENDQSKVYVLGTIVVEKIFDMIFIVISIVLLLPQVVFPIWVSEPSEVTAILVMILIVIGGLIAWKREAVFQRIEIWSKYLPARFRQGILRQINNLLTSLECVRNFRQLMNIFIWTFLIWVFGFGTNLLVFWAMGLPLSFLPSIFLLVVLQVGVAVPSSPGRIGVFHYLTVLALSVFSIDKGVALSCGIILHLIVYVPLTVLGAYYIWEEKLSWSRIMKTVSLASFRGKN
ncbi:MAG TPA: lysylphosphatidylglycerol synthase transmembrane domain-containing protein [Leptolinea sp.]